MSLWPRSIEPFFQQKFFSFLHIYIYSVYAHILHSLKYMESTKVCKADPAIFEQPVIRDFSLTLVFFDFSDS